MLDSNGTAAVTSSDPIPLGNVDTKELGRRNALGRWAPIGPYYAMFPLIFAFKTVAHYCPIGGAVLDPFAGRGTSIYAAVTQGRTGYGIELHPVGWVYGKAKLMPASKNYVLKRIDEISKISNDISEAVIDELPEFFRVCYSRNVLKFLVAARENLRWRKQDKKIPSVPDTTLAAIILVHLHGKLGSALSNQLRQGKAMDPNYSVRWWQKRNMLPPEIDPCEFLKKRVEYRYAKGIPAMEKGHIELGDSTIALKRLAGKRRKDKKKPFDLVLTSPPYNDVTNYFYDQWIRIWFLGGQEVYSSSGKKWERKFASKTDYRELLTKVFQGCAENTHRNSVIYVRTDAREYTRDTTIEILRDSFPNKKLEVIKREYTKPTQTALYGDKSSKPGEVDIILSGYSSKKSKTKDNEYK